MTCVLNRSPSPGRLRFSARSKSLGSQLFAGLGGLRSSGGRGISMDFLRFCGVDSEDLNVPDKRETGEVCVRSFNVGFIWHVGMGNHHDNNDDE